MKTAHTFPLITILASTLLLLSQPPSTAALLDPAATVAAARDIEFVRTSCQTTLYPKLCYASLASYASAVQQDASRLARVAVGVSLKRARRVAAYVDTLSRRADSRATAAALRDCLDQLGDSVDQITDSLRQMNRLGLAGSGSGGSAQELRFELSNVLTWMSAAETNEDTCVEGFDDVASGPLKADVYDAVVKVKQVTSNALALVNDFANKIAIP